MTRPQDEIRDWLVPIYNAVLVFEEAIRQGVNARELIPQAKLVIYDGGSHGLLHVDKDRLNADLLRFLRG